MGNWNHDRRDANERLYRLLFGSAVAIIDILIVALIVVLET